MTRLATITVHDRATGAVRLALRGVEPQVLSTSPLVVADGDSLVGITSDADG